MKALVIVDLQNDFLPGGALPAPSGHKIIPVINRLAGEFDIVTASRDWHPGNSIHFEKWPEHCVKGTKGAEFPEKLNQDEISKVFLKGTGNRDDGYSLFEATNYNPERYFSEKKVNELYITGLTTEHCVYQTAMDALWKGYATYLVRDAVAPVEPDSDKEKEALAKMKKAGIRFVKSEEII